jgi:alpha-glucoside transport system substrate-binding protein
LGILWFLLGLGTVVAVVAAAWLFDLIQIGRERQPAEVTRLIDVTKLVEVTRQVEATRIVEVTSEQTSIVTVVLTVEVPAELGPTPTPEPPEPSTPVPTPSYLDRAYAGEFSGTKVRVVGDCKEDKLAKLEGGLAGFAEQTGIDFQYDSDEDYERSIEVQVLTGHPPDVGHFREPSQLLPYAEAGHLVDIGSRLDWGDLAERYAFTWLDMATMEGPSGPMLAAIWGRVGVRSLVWYPRSAFEAAGYTVPLTWQDLLDLSDRMVADGRTPWCLGNRYYGLDGLPAADFVDQLLLRTASPLDYDRWFSGELSFTSAEVRRAGELAGQIWLEDAYIYGGRQVMRATNWVDAYEPMVRSSPECWLYLAGDWITERLAEDGHPGIVYDFFPMPPVDAAWGQPLVVNGDLWAVFNDRPEVWAVVEFLSRGESLRGTIEAGYGYSPHLDSDPAWQTNELRRKIASTLLTVETARPRAAFQMPEEVGKDAWYRGLTQWLGGELELETVLVVTDASWP